MEEELKFIISTEENGAEDAARKATTAIRQVGKVFTEIRGNIKKAAAETKRALDTVVDNVGSAVKEMSDRYDGMSLAQLQSEFVKLEERIIKQKTLVEQANKALEQHYRLWGEVAKAGGSAGGADSGAGLYSLIMAAEQATGALKALKAEQYQVAQAINAKTNSSQQLADMDQQINKVNQSSARMSKELEAAAEKIGTTGKSSDGTAKEVASLFQQVSGLIKGFTAAGETAITTSTVISTAFGVAGIAIMAVTMIINAITAAAEESAKKLKEAREGIEQLRGDNKGASDLIGEYEEISSKTVKTADDTQRMLDIRAELVSEYGFSVAAVDEEGRLLTGNLESMKEQLKVSQELLKLNLEANQVAEQNAYEDAIKKRTELLQQLKATEESLADPEGDLNDARMVTVLAGGDAPASTDEEIQEYVSNLTSQRSGIKAQIILTEAEARKSLEALCQTLINASGDVPEVMQTAISDALSKAISAAYAEGTELTYEEAGALAQSMLDAYAIVGNMVESTGIDNINNFRDSLITAFASEEGTDPKEDIQWTNDLMNAIIGDDAQMESAFARLDELREKILSMQATPEEMEEYANLTYTVVDGLAGAQDLADQAVAEGVPGAEDAQKAVLDLSRTYLKSADSLTRFAAKEKAANMTLKSAASTLRSVASEYENVFDAINEVANLKNAVQAIDDYNNATDKTGEMAENAAAARAYLAGLYGTEEDAIDDMLPSIKEDIGLKETLALMDYQVALINAYAAQAMVKAWVYADGTVTKAEQNIIDQTQQLINKLIELGNTSIPAGGDSINPSDTLPFKPSGGGGGGGTNKKLQKQLDQIEHKKALDQLTTAEEIALLEKALSKYAKTTAEKEELTEKLYDLKKQKAQEDMNYEEAMDRLTLREKIAELDKMIATYKEGTEARRDLEKQRYEAMRELERQEYDLKVYYSQMTLKEQEAYLKELISTYEEGVEARIEAEKELYDVQQEIKEQQIDELTSLTEAVMDAVKERYEAMREAETKTLEASIDAWQEWGDEQTAAIQKQIDAIDEMAEAQARAEEEAEKRATIASLEQQLLYETDSYNSRKLEEELAKAKEDLQDWLAEQEREALKVALEDQIDAINATVDEQTSALEEQLDAVDEYYDAMTEDAKLQAEAQKLLLASTQEEILALLEAFAPDYNITGQSLGEQLYEGFIAKVGDIDAWFESLTEKLTAYQAELAAVATAAADAFYAANGMTSASTTTTTTTNYVSPTFNLYFTQDTMTPSEVRAELEKLIEEMTDL